MLKTSAMVKKAKEGRVAYVEHLCNGQEGKGGAELHMLNTSAMVKKAKEDRVAYVEHLCNGQGVVYVEHEHCKLSMTPLVHPFIRSFDSSVHPFIRSSKISTQAFIRSSVHPNGLTQAFIRSSVHPFV